MSVRNGRYINHVCVLCSRMTNTRWSVNNLLHHTHIRNTTLSTQWCIAYTERHFAFSAGAYDVTLDVAGRPILNSHYSAWSESVRGAAAASPRSVCRRACMAYILAENYFRFRLTYSDRTVVTRPTSHVKGHSLQNSYILVAVLLFFSFEATAQQRWHWTLLYR